MKISPYTLLCAAALVGALASCSSPSSNVTRVPVSSPIVKQSSLADQVFAEVNSYRSAKGKPSLQRHAGLDQLAQQHCDYLAKTSGSYSIYGKNVSHIGIEGRALSARQSYQITSLGENVIMSPDRSAKHLVRLWAESKGHEYNMRSDWACTGVATAVTPDGQVISTQIFGVLPSTSHRSSLDRSRDQW